MWEYTVLILYGTFAENLQRLNEYGAKGWELVTVLDTDILVEPGGDYVRHAFFKRPIQDDDGDYGN